MLIKFRMGEVGWDYRECSGFAVKEALPISAAEEASCQYQHPSSSILNLCYLRLKEDVDIIISYNEAYLLSESGETISRLG